MSSSMTFPRPPQTGVTTDVPSNSTHFVEPVSGSMMRETCVLKRPRFQSKSALRSFAVTAGATGSGLVRVSCATQFGSQVLPPSAEKACSNL